MKSLPVSMLTIFLFFYGSVAYGQSKSEVATEKNSVTKEAQSQLAVLSSENGALNVYCKENSISGEFVMDLTIQGKGKLVTIYMVSSTVEDVKYQNILKNKLMQLQFENIKLPKNERVKFRHILTF